MCLVSRRYPKSQDAIRAKETNRPKTEARGNGDEKTFPISHRTLLLAERCLKSAIRRVGGLVDTKPKGVLRSLDSSGVFSKWADAVVFRILQQCKVKRQ